MLSIAWSTVRIRWTSFAGACVALALGGTLISMMALALAATIGGSQDLVQGQSMAATTAGITGCGAVFIVIATFAFAVVGWRGGCLGASILNRWMIAHEVAPAWFRIGVNPVALVIAFTLSVAAALIGAATVVWRASRVRPAAALREAGASRRAMTPLRWVLGLRP